MLLFYNTRDYFLVPGSAEYVALLLLHLRCILYATLFIER